MVELKCIDEEEKDNIKQRNIKNYHFPLEQYAEVGKNDNFGDPHLKAAAKTELYEFEKSACNDDFEHEDLQPECEIQNENENTKFSHMQPVGETKELHSKGNILTRKSYGPVYVLFKEDGQHILIPQEADMSRKKI